MSIPTEIEIALKSGKLSILELMVPSDPVERTVLLHPELKALLKDASGTDGGQSALRRIGRLQADLEAFVTGKIVTMCLTPREHGVAFMGLLDPAREGTFDIRSRDPAPGMRVFGRFAMVDVFVALTNEFRSRTPDWDRTQRQPLADGDSHLWQFAMIECQKRWNEIFTNSPITGGTVRDFISANSILV